MRWFRSNLRSGAGCALFAILLQLVLTFGHVHALATSKFGQHGAVAQQSASSQHRPSKTGTPDDDWRDCDVCRLTQFAGMGLTSAPPALSQPIPTGTMIVPLVLRDRLQAARPLPFNARAPPTA